MPSTKEDPVVSALQVVYAALKALDTAERDRVLSSALALLGEAAPTPKKTVQASPVAMAGSTGTQTRPVSLIEIVKERQPKSNIDFITLFAFYRDQIEGKPRFGRNDLKAYFAAAKQNPPGNFDRDFVNAVKRGWLHEEGDESYITSLGMEAVVSGFPGEAATKKRKPSASTRSPKRSKAKPTRRKT